MGDFAASSKRASLLSCLQSISLSVLSTKISDDWLKALEMALSDSPLTHFHLYSMGMSLSSTPISTSAEVDFVTSFMLQHGSRLERFAVLRTPFRPQSLQTVAQMGSTLKQLFISMWKKDLVRLYSATTPQLTHISCSTFLAPLSRHLAQSGMFTSHTHTTHSATLQKSTMIVYLTMSVMTRIVLRDR